MAETTKRHEMDSRHNRPGGLTRTTTDIEEIKKWVESKNGRPARVVGTETGDPKKNRTAAN